MFWWGESSQCCGWNYIKQSKALLIKDLGIYIFIFSIPNSKERNTKVLQHFLSYIVKLSTFPGTTYLRSIYIYRLLLCLDTKKCTSMNNLIIYNLLNSQHMPFKHWCDYKIGMLGAQYAMAFLYCPEVIKDKFKTPCLHYISDGKWTSNKLTFFTHIEA